MDQLSSLKREAFSILNWESKESVACKFEGDNLLCSVKNCCFLVIYRASEGSEGKDEDEVFIVYRASEGSEGKDEDEVFIAYRASASRSEGQKEENLL